MVVDRKDGEETTIFLSVMKYEAEFVWNWTVFDGLESQPENEFALV